LKSTDISEEYVASIFRVEEQAYYLLHAGFLLGLVFDLEDGGEMFLRNLG
jgi:hypothetical protein